MTKRRLKEILKETNERLKYYRQYSRSSSDDLREARRKIEELKEDIIFYEKNYRRIWEENKGLKEELKLPEWMKKFSSNSEDQTFKVIWEKEPSRKEKIEGIEEQIKALQEQIKKLWVGE